MIEQLRERSLKSLRPIIPLAYSILTRLVCKDTNHLRQVLHKQDSENQRHTAYRNIYLAGRKHTTFDQSVGR